MCTHTQTHTNTNKKTHTHMYLPLSHTHTHTHSNCTCAGGYALSPSGFCVSDTHAAAISTTPFQTGVHSEIKPKVSGFAAMKGEEGC